MNEQTNVSKKFIVVLIVLIAIGSFLTGAGFASSQIEEVAEEDSRRAEVQSIANKIELYRHRIRQEEEHDCMSRYMREIVLEVIRRGDVSSVTACEGDRGAELQKELDAEIAHLRELDPENLSLRE